MNKTLLDMYGERSTSMQKGIKLRAARGQRNHILPLDEVFGCSLESHWDQLCCCRLCAYSVYTTKLKDIVNLY